MVQSGGIVIRVGTIGCSAYGSSAATSLRESDVFSGRLEQDLVANMALNNAELSPSD